MSGDSFLQVAVSLVAEDEKYRIPEQKLFLSSGSTPQELNELVSHLGDHGNMTLYIMHEL